MQKRLPGLHWSVESQVADTLPCALQNVTLSPIHYRAVQRIYGEHGHQMVKLMKENPAYAIPIVFKRLQQKDAEWCATAPSHGSAKTPASVSTLL